MIRRNPIQRQVRRAAFTLMEMMLVVAIIVALAGIGIFFLAPQAEEGNKTKALADVQNLTQAALKFKLDHKEWPPDLASLAREVNGYGPYIQNELMLIDPWGRPYQYIREGPRNNGKQPDIWSEGPPSSNFFYSNWIPGKPIPRN